MDIVARARGSITRPRDEWRTIAQESWGAAGLSKGCVIPVSAVPVAAGFIGVALFARLFAAAPPGFSIGGPLAQSVPSCVLGLAAVWMLGKVVQALAPRFGGTGEAVRRP